MYTRHSSYVSIVIIAWYNNYMMLDALYIYSQRYVVTSYIWNHLVLHAGGGSVMCKSRECHYVLSVDIITCLL